MLPFQEEIVDACVNTASILTVVAPGIGIFVAISETLKRLKDDELILVINMSSQDFAQFTNNGVELTSLDPGLKDSERYEAYRRGGLVAASKRNFTVDLLKERIPYETLKGVVVLHAENVTASTQDTFILKILHDLMKRPYFVKAFSESPDRLSGGFSPLQKVMQYLGIRDVQLWPRFHEHVQRDLRDHQADVVELYQPLSSSMVDIQNAILECMEATLGDLRRANPLLVNSTSEYSVEQILSHPLDAIVSKWILPASSQSLGYRARQLLNDLSLLKSLLDLLLNLDCVSFHQLLQTILSENSDSMLTQTQQQFRSPWLFLPVSDTIFRTARNRVLVPGTNETPPQVVLEHQPKWHLLFSVLSEIQEEQRSPDLESLSQSVLIMCSSDRTVSTISHFLAQYSSAVADGADSETKQFLPFLTERLHVFQEWKRSLDAMSKNVGAKKAAEVPHPPPATMPSSQSQAPPRSSQLAFKDRGGISAKRRRMRGSSTASALTSQRERGEEVIVPDEPEKNDVFSQSGMRGLDIPDVYVPTFGAAYYDKSGAYAELVDDRYYGLVPKKDMIHIRTYSVHEDAHILETERPNYIIMYDASPAFIRQVELFQSRNPGHDVRVYFLMYKDSTDEQQYLASIRREKDAFEKLIRERNTMAITIDDVRPENKAGSKSIIDKALTTSTRKGGGGRVILAEGPSKIIVDMREFRSSLPSLLYQGGFAVIPVTLSVGDYILTPDIAVERKSLPDLMSSLNSGRLYQQCELMTSHYKTPCLLIEFDENKPFNLAQYIETAPSKTDRTIIKTLSSRTSDLSAGDFDLLSKLSLLVLTFPKLRILWASSAFQSVEIIKDIKEGQFEPDLDEAIKAGAGDTKVESGDPDPGYDPVAQEVLHCLPGITSKNYRYVMSRVSNLRELVSLSLAEMQDLIGIESGQRLHTFVNTHVT